MNKIYKFLLILVIIGFQSSQAYPQNILLKALNSFNEVVDGFEKLLDAFNQIDSDINKDKARAMASELYGEIGDLILVKDSLIFVLENSNGTNPEFGKYIRMLESKLEVLQETLQKYDQLISAAGINTQKLKSGLEQEFWLKAQTLEEARGLMNANLGDQEIKENLIFYFKSCVNILKRCQDVLEDFEP